MKVALVTLARNENRYLKEWIDHYLRIGFDHIIIGDNNDVIGDENIANFISRIKYEDYVTVIDVRKTSVDTINVQNQFFNETYNKFKYEYDWIAFFDVDEFFYASHDWSRSNNIKEYIDKCHKAVKEKYNVELLDQIRVGWVTYGDNDQLFYDERPVQQRFPYPSSKIFLTDSKNNICGKSILRGELDVTFNNSHIAVNPDIDVYTAFNGGDDIGLRMLDPCTFFIHNDGVLRHYITKSVEEYFFRKIQDSQSYLNKNYDDDPLTYYVNNYFNINERTPQKERLFKYLIEAYCKNNINFQDI